jgi:hypothetical protein
MMREGGLALSGSVTQSLYTPRAVLAVRLGTKCRRVQTLVRFCSYNTFQARERRGARALLSCEGGDQESPAGGKGR